MIKYFIKKHFTEEELICLRSIRKRFWKVNWIKTIWINFTALKFKQAIHFPIIIGYNVRLNPIGQILINNKVYFGMITLALDEMAVDHFAEPVVITNRGIIVFSGRTVLRKGVKINLRRNAVIEFGHLNTIGSGSRLVSLRSIHFGDNCRVSWDCQIFDTDFHFMYNIEKDFYYPRTKPIYIGNNNFIGNHCTIAKGTVLPEGCVVSCCTKVSGDFTNEGTNLLIIGNPGRVVKKGVEMCSGFFPEQEMKIASILE